MYLILSKRNSLRESKRALHYKFYNKISYAPLIKLFNVIKRYNIIKIRQKNKYAL